MKTRRTILPGQPGSKKWVERYGEKLVCVRYRYDEERKEALKTVEIVVERRHWKKNSKRIPKNKIVKVKIFYGELELALIVKRADGRWNAREKVWELAYGQVCALNLTNRLVK
jgi:hypothetical protein